MENHSLVLNPNGEIKGEKGAERDEEWGRGWAENPIFPVMTYSIHEAHSGFGWSQRRLVRPEEHTQNKKPSEAE